MNFRISKQQKQILNRIQSGFPIANAPYTLLSGELGLPNRLILNQIIHLKRHQLIRRLGGIFQSQSLGYKSLLCGVKLDPKYVNQVGTKIAQYKAVTHCYARNHTYNVWFTLTGKTNKEIKSILTEIDKMHGVQEILVLPSVKTFKIRTEFKVA
ncbi:MAG: Lrp/AsnC family transcriptional regulator [bacterium]